MNKRIILILLPIMICCSRNINQNDISTASSSPRVCINDSCKFFKVNIADKYLDSILLQYTKMYDFNGDGVILTTIRNNGDTTRYYVNLFLGKDFFEHWLMDKKFLFYDSIGDRITILYTGYEDKLELTTNPYLGDTILNNYLRTEKMFGISEIWQIEYTRVGKRITYDVYYEYPF